MRRQPTVNDSMEFFFQNFKPITCISTGLSHHMYVSKLSRMTLIEER